MEQPEQTLADSPGPAIVTDERTGQQYTSVYLYERQFEAEFEQATAVLRHRYGTATERYAWVIALVSWVLFSLSVQGIVFIVTAMKAGPIIIGAIQVGSFALLLLLFVLALRWSLGGRDRFHRRLVEQRLCFNCGYPLVGQRVDSRGIGRCPECGCTFNVTRYLRPPKRYHGLERSDQY